jgi:hypothetical protein
MQTRAGGLIGKICWGGFVLLHQLAEEAETGGRYFPLLSRIAVGARAESQEDRVLDKDNDVIFSNSVSVQNQICIMIGMNVHPEFRIQPDTMFGKN